MKTYKLTYFSSLGDKILILIEAKSQKHCEKIFRKKYGMYHIVEIKEAK